jgi:putative membrane protein
MSAQTERYLVLCVDRDDDLGTKTHVTTPVVGRQAVVSAATDLAIADPEEADANSIFAAVKKHDELSRSGLSGEVAVACGNRNGGFEADRKLRREVEGLLAGSNYTGIVFVSDGGEDEQIIPVLQGMKPVVSVLRVAVKHSQSVEQTYLVLGRYLRMLVFDSRYSKWALGVPGVIFLMATILIVFNQGFAALVATLVIIGGTFIIRGFNLDRWIAEILSRGPYGYIRLFSTVTSFLVVLVGISNGYGIMARQTNAEGYILVNLVQANPGLLLTLGGTLVGYFLQGSLLLVWAGLAIYATGTLLARLLRGGAGAWRDAVLLVMLGLLYFPILSFADFLVGGQRASEFALITYVLVGLAAIFGLTSALYPRIRTRGTDAAE